MATEGRKSAGAPSGARRGSTGALAAAGPRIEVPAGDPLALARALAVAPAGALLLVPEGVHRGPFVVRRDVAIRGAGPARTALSGDGAAPVLALAEAGARLRLSQATVREGAAHQGGGLAVVARGRVLVEDCVFTGCIAAAGGGAVYAAAGDLAMRRVLVQRSSAPIGGAFLLDGTARVALEDAVVEENDAREGGGLYLREGARLKLKGVTVRRNGAVQGASALEAHGSRSRAPEVDVSGGALAGGRPTVRLVPAPGAAARPALVARDATLALEVRSLAGFADLGGCTYV